MSMLAKLSALFRGTAHEAGQSVVDANALKILDQEIRDADNDQGKARDDLAGLVARRRMAENEIKSFRTRSPNTRTPPAPPWSGPERSGARGRGRIAETRDRDGRRAGR